MDQAANTTAGQSSRPGGRSQGFQDGADEEVTNLEVPGLVLAHHPGTTVIC